MKIIFIASLSHSGSTLLDLMLNAHPDVVSVGELKQLGRFARFQKRKQRHRCTCGAESVWECSFWSQVTNLTKAASGQTIADLNVEDYAVVDSFGRDNLILFDAIATASSKEYIVDSSKDRSRLGLLLSSPELDVFPIFLLRDPKGQICSSLRKGKRQLNVAELIATYVTTNRDIYRIVKDTRHAVIRYEDLVRRPESTLNALMPQLGLDFHPQQLNWANPERHNVGGNHMRWGKSSELKVDDAWRRVLSFSQKLAIDAGTLPGRFPLVRFGHPLGGARAQLRLRDIGSNRAGGRKPTKSTARVH